MASKCIGSKFLHVSSRNRTFGSRSDFSVNIPSDVFENKLDNKYLKLNLQEITLNYSWYSVQDGVNNLFTFHNNTSNTDTAIYIPAGSYNVTDFNTFLNNKLSGSYTVTYSSSTNKYTFTSADPLNTIRSQGAGQFLGLEDNTTTTGTFTSTRPVDMTYINTVYLHSDISKINETFDNLDSKIMSGSTILARIPVDVAPFSNINYKIHTNTNDGVKLAVSQLDSIRFFFTDDKGNPLNLTTDTTLVIRLEIYQM